MRDPIAFDRSVWVDGVLGAGKQSWTQLFECRGQIFFKGGSEGVEAGSYQAQEQYKVRIRNGSHAKSLLASDRLRLLSGAPPEASDGLPGARFNIVSVDTMTSRKWAWVIIKTSEVQN
jgi:hypothetical protein